MKKRILVFAACMTALAISGCGNDNKKETEKATEVKTVVTTESVSETHAEETTEAVTQAETESEKESKERRTQAETESTEAVTEAPKVEATKDNAKPFVGKTLDELKAAVGDCKKFETAGACLEDENELNGIATYDNFTVYCHSVEGQTKWIIDAIE